MRLLILLFLCSALVCASYLRQPLMEYDFYDPSDEPPTFDPTNPDPDSGYIDYLDPSLADDLRTDESKPLPPPNAAH
ncbi:hypothetical protein L596_010668 [Steinernema carpocapsae]|uniref:Uncharacterized protein n=1 Tax=Steinernema carpocapsae TaxID=34508 RepID=A0A4V6A722_STECR|nr:hypothetical protein L596_010668 [Steinernema carpocapsae]